MGLSRKNPILDNRLPQEPRLKKHIDSASSDSDDLTPINFDDILNDLPVDDDLTPINFDDIQFDDDLPERRFDVGRDKENAIQKAKQYLTTPAPAENIIAEQFILKENFISMDSSRQRTDNFITYHQTIPIFERLGVIVADKSSLQHRLCILLSRQTSFFN